MSAQLCIDRETEEGEIRNRPGTRTEETRWLNRCEIATLSDAQIEGMDRERLIELVRASEHPWDDSEMAPHLEFADRWSLLRLAFLARRYCQNAELAAHDLAIMDELDGSHYQRNVGTMFGQPR